MENYRYETGKLYEYDSEQNAYIFVCSNPFNLSVEDLIEEYEEEMNAEGQELETFCTEWMD